MKPVALNLIGRLAGWLAVLAVTSLTMNAAETKESKTQLATFGGGCFWCVEAVIEGADGVKSVVSGYAGGKTPNPTYKAVCGGDTGHAEVVQVEFDPAKISFEKLLQLFFRAHDPTTLNKQGADEGTQYRSIILYHDEAQKAAAEKVKKEVAGRFQRPVVTEIVPLTKFYPAEDYHQDYFRKNPNASYCVFVIRPKLDKLKKEGK
ncbi:MAG: peptide-methionine (S)-S-oxide reductase MsrA [Verrucomicrobiota bacterium]